MWHFISRSIQRSYLRRAFSPYISKTVLNDLLRNPNQPLWRETKPVVRDYLIFQVQESSLESTQQHVSAGVDIILDCGGILEGIICSVVMATFGFPFTQDSMIGDEKARAQAAACLTRTLGSNVRVIHGRSEARVGNHGSDRRLSYGSLIPGFAGRLETLQNLDFGQSIEL
jgi:hypothetical protein